MKVLQARERATTYHVEVWLDTSKTIDDPAWTRPTVTDPESGAQIPDTSAKAPQVTDPAWVQVFDWGKDRPAGMSKAQHLTNIRAEIRAQCLATLAARSTPVETPIATLEGQDL